LLFHLDAGPGEAQHARERLGRLGLRNPRMRSGGYKPLTSRPGHWAPPGRSRQPLTGQD